jgi:hypothetical protein
MIEHRIFNSTPYLCLAFWFLFFLLHLSISCFYFVVFSLSSCPFRLLRNLFNKSFIIYMIRLESDLILLLDVHCFNLYVYWRLDIYPIITSNVPIHFWFILYRLYHQFQFILESDFTPCMAQCSNSYRKYSFILYREDGSNIHDGWI